MSGAAAPRPPRSLVTPPRSVREAARDLAHALDHLEAWLAAASAT
jgi:hypothetical protein